MESKTEHFAGGLTQTVSFIKRVWAWRASLSAELYLAGSDNRPTGEEIERDEFFPVCNVTQAQFYSVVSH